MRLVIIESPFAGDRDANLAYARRALADSLTRGEAPFASHLLYPQALDDDDAADRLLGITAGLAWGNVADATIVYGDRGISDGMEVGIGEALRVGRRVEYRLIEAPA